MEETRGAARERFAELRKVGKDKRAERRALLKRIEELDSEIEQNRLKCLAAKNDYAQIHVLPSEVLSTVFQQACLCEERMEIKLSRVCRLWRSITLSSPNLWSTFTYCDSLPEVKRLAIYLERSRNRPVDLLFYIHNGGRSAVVRQLLGKAIKHVFRWRRFSLLVQEEDSWPSGDLFAPLVDVSAPHLQRFEVSTSALYFHGYMDEAHRTLPFRNIFKGGTPLLSCVRLDSNAAAGFMPLSNITTLEIERIHEDSYQWPFIKFLCLFDLPLVNLSLIGEIYEAAKARTQQLTTKTLKIFRCNDSIVNAFFRYIHAPQLEVLILKEVFPSSPTSSPHDFCFTTFPSLHTLSLVDCNVHNFEMLSHFAQATNCITRLYVSFTATYFRQTVDPLYHMAKNSHQTILWPRLNTLTYLIRPETKEDMADINFECYIDVLECRSRILNTHCTLNLKASDAEHWKTLHPASWNRLQKGDFYREMQPTGGCYAPSVGMSTAIDQEYIYLSIYPPFPSTPFDEFHRRSKDPFMTLIEWL